MPAVRKKKTIFAFARNDNLARPLLPSHTSPYPALPSTGITPGATLHLVVSKKATGSAPTTAPAAIDWNTTDAGGRRDNPVAAKNAAPLATPALDRWAGVALFVSNFHEAMIVIQSASDTPARTRT